MTDGQPALPPSRPPAVPELEKIIAEQFKIEEAKNEATAWLEQARGVLVSSVVCTRVGINNQPATNTSAVLIKRIPVRTRDGGDAREETDALLQLQSTLAGLGLQLEAFHKPSALRLQQLESQAVAAAVQRQTAAT